MASGLCGVFGRQGDWTAESAAPASIRYVNAPSRTPKASLHPDSRFNVSTIDKFSTFNTLREVSCGAAKLLVFATGAEMNLVTYISAAELEDASFGSINSPYDSVGADRCLALNSKILSIELSGRSVWTPDSSLLVLTTLSLYHVRVEASSSGVPCRFFLKLISKFSLSDRVYSVTSVPHSHPSAAALLLRDPSRPGGAALHLWDLAAGLRLHSQCPGGGAPEADSPMPVVQYSHHPQVVHTASRNRLHRVDLRANAPQLMFEAKDAYIVNSSVPPNTSHASYSMGLGDNHLFITQSNRKVLLLDVRHSARPVAIRAVPESSHCIVRAYSAADFRCPEYSSESDTVLFVGTSRCAASAYVHSMTPWGGGGDFKPALYNACTEFGAVGSLAWDISAVPVYRHRSVSPIDATEGVVGAELMALGSLKLCDTGRNSDDSYDAGAAIGGAGVQYNSLFCQQNALTGDISVQRMYVGPKAFLASGERRGLHVEGNLPSVPDAPVGAPQNTEIKYRELPVDLTAAHGNNFKMNIRSKSAASANSNGNIHAFVAANIAFVRQRLEAVGTLTLHELYRMLVTRGRGALKERFARRAEKVNRQGIMNAFRKVVIAEYVSKGWLVEQLLDDAVGGGEAVRSRMRCLGDGLVVSDASSEGAGAAVCACGSCDHSTAFQYADNLVQGDWSKWELCTPCAAVECQFSHLLIYSLPVGASRGPSRTVNFTAVVQSTINSKKRLRDQAAGSGEERSFSTYSDISSGDIASLRQSWDMMSTVSFADL